MPLSDIASWKRFRNYYYNCLRDVDRRLAQLLWALKESGQIDNTIILYLWGDNGSSAEGQNGSISELLAQNQIPNTIAQQIKALDGLGGLKALGGHLGLLQADPQDFLKAGAGLDEAAIQAQIAARAAAKAAKNFAEADRIRNDLLAQGIVLKDSASGTTWEAAQ